MACFSSIACCVVALSELPYCSDASAGACSGSSLAGGLLSATAALASLARLACRSSSPLGALGASSIVLASNAAAVSIVTAPVAGVGRDVGNAYVSSWIAFALSLRLWKVCLESYLAPPVAPCPLLPMRGCALSRYCGDDDKMKGSGRSGSTHRSSSSASGKVDGGRSTNHRVMMLQDLRCSSGEVIGDTKFEFDLDSRGDSSSLSPYRIALRRARSQGEHEVHSPNSAE